ncbi:MAG TPA: extracellular solute-binding protein [Chloroflexota bacterium]|nr:extracellular solute-binding protein [Chloroflexota bacterium]
MRRLVIAFLGMLLLASSAIGANRVVASQAHSASAAPASKLTGCDGKGTVSYMFWGDSGDNAAHLASIKAAEKACKGLHVNPIWDSGNYDTDLATKVGSGNAPDLFQLDASKRIPEYVSLGALAPIDSLVKQYKVNMKKVYWAQCVNELTYKKHLYGLPRTCSNQSLLFYNKEMFTARGVKFPTNNWTYTDLANAGRKLSGTYSLPHDSTSQLRFGLAFNHDDFRVEQFMWDWGGDWLNSKLNACTMTSKQARAGLQALHDLSYKYHAAPTAAQASGLPDYFSGFQKERYAMAFMGPWALDYAFGKKPGGTPQISFNWGVALTPKGPVTRQAVMAATGLVIYKSSSAKKAAFWLARFDSVGPGAVLTGAYGVDTPGAIALWNNPQIVSEYGKAALATIRLGNQTGRYPRLVPQYDKFWGGTIDGDLTPFWQDTASVQQATSKACDDVTSKGLLG